MFGYSPSIFYPKVSLGWRRVILTSLGQLIADNDRFTGIERRNLWRKSPFVRIKRTLIVFTDRIFEQSTATQATMRQPRLAIDCSFSLSNFLLPHVSRCTIYGVQASTLPDRRSARLHIWLLLPSPSPRTFQMGLASVQRNRQTYFEC